MPHTTLVFNGGPTPSTTTLAAARAIENVDLIIAADSGLHTAQQLGLRVDVVIGDFDSVDESALARATSRGAQTIRHSHDKDFTDLHSAVQYAADREPKKIVVVTGEGGRLDHQLSVVAALFDPRLQKIEVEALWGDSRLYALQGPTEISFATRVGDFIGLQSFSDKSEGVSTTGLRWPLKTESLTNFETRGVSNEAVCEEVAVSIQTGQLLVIHQYGATA